MLTEAKILSPVEVYQMLPEEFTCEVIDGRFCLGSRILPNWFIYELLQEGSRIQLVNDQFIVSPSPSVKHQQLLMDIAYELFIWTKAQKTGIAVIGPLDVHLSEKEIFTPDILFVSNERSDIIFENGVYGVPDLIVEVLLPSTATLDLNEKKKVYLNKKVKEYWAVDSATKEVIGFELGAKGYKEIPKTTGIITSKLLGKSFKF